MSTTQAGEARKSLRPSIPRLGAAGLGGAVIGVLGGLIGLGGAEFRLPLLIGAFRFVALEAIILNKAMSLVVVGSALPFRFSAVPSSAVTAEWPVIVNLLAGSLLGAWLSAGWATRLKAASLHRIIAVALIGIALVLLVGHEPSAPGRPPLSGSLLIAAGVLAGLLIGAVAALLGVAGGELLIPTLVLLFGLDIKLAGSVSLVVSLPTMMVGFARYSQDASFAVIGRNKAFVVTMALGSVAGAFAGAHLLHLVPAAIIVPILTAILMISAVKVWRHQ
jgi:hypothetical protein